MAHLAEAAQRAPPGSEGKTTHAVVLSAALHMRALLWKGGHMDRCQAPEKPAPQTPPKTPPTPHQDKSVTPGSRHNAVPQAAGGWLPASFRVYF